MSASPSPGGSSSDGSSTRGSSTGLNSNVAAAFAYLLGFISGVTMLIIEREDRYVRFHAVQSVLVFLAALVATMIAASLPAVGWLLRALMSVATAVLWLFLMFKALTGERYKLPYVGEIAERQVH
jgi:uncharacterized membrane protein